MYGYGYGYGFDWTYILVLIGVAVTMLASARMKSTFARYAGVRSASGLTGREVAQRILNANGIYDVAVLPVAGRLTDHYNPAKKTVNLSELIYNSTSVAAIGVAAHECGHAIQDNRDYAPLRFRTAFFPAANLGSGLSWPMIIGGLLLARSGAYIGYTLMSFGILLFSLAVIFQLITLPVEFDASRRALRQLSETGILPCEEEKQARAVLFAAALTYVAAASASLLQLLRLIILFGGRRSRD
ncbi:MAG: zinc metallopeptidase [Stomatobaculum sp.]